MATPMPPADLEITASYKHPGMWDQRKYEFDNVYLYYFCEFWIKTAEPTIESFLHCILLAQQQKEDDGFHSCSSSKDLEQRDVMKLVKLFAMFNVACQVYDYMTPKYMYIYISIIYPYISKPSVHSREKFSGARWSWWSTSKLHTVSRSHRCLRCYLPVDMAKGVII